MICENLGECQEQGFLLEYAQEHSAGNLRMSGVIPKATPAGKVKTRNLSQAHAYESARSLLGEHFGFRRTCNLVHARSITAIRYAQKVPLGGHVRDLYGKMPCREGQIAAT